MNNLSSVNKMLKTVKKLFTITSFITGAHGAIFSKFEAQNKNKKETDGQDYFFSESEGRSR